MTSHHCLALLLVATSLLAPAQGVADEEPEPTRIHWAMASLLGTGWYQFDDNRSVFVLRIPPRQVLRASSLENDERELGVEIKYNLTLGIHDIFQPTAGLEDEDLIGTVAFTPGVELEVPLNEQWTLRPFAHLGWGTETSLDDSAWIWFGGIKSRYTLPNRKNVISFIGNLYYGGYRTDLGDDDEITGLALGMEGAFPHRRHEPDASGLEWDWHFTYTHFTNQPFLVNDDGPGTTIDEILEVGIAMSPQGERFDFWLWKPERLGLSVKWDPNGDFSGIGINMTSWFRR